MTNHNYWSDDTTQVLKQKTLGQAIMVSDFIEEVDGFLECDGEPARLYLEGVGKNGSGMGVGMGRSRVKTGSGMGR